MWQIDLIRAPLFYISAYFETHRSDHYDGLLAVSRDDDWTGWCRFFLEAVQAQAEDNLEKAQGILDLYDSMKGRVIDLTRSKFAITALDWIFVRLIFRSIDFVTAAGVERPTARRILGALRESGILAVAVKGRGRQSAILAFPELLDVVKGGDAR